jgi:hypothetical protein
MNYGSSIHNLAKSNTIEDRIEVPTNIKPQDYVLQWRCELPLPSPVPFPSHGLSFPSLTLPCLALLSLS